LRSVISLADECNPSKFRNGNPARQPKPAGRVDPARVGPQQDLLRTHPGPGWTG
jgi:hypothetical protein